MSLGCEKENITLLFLPFHTKPVIAEPNKKFIFTARFLPEERILSPNGVFSLLLRAFI